MPLWPLLLLCRYGHCCCFTAIATAAATAIATAAATAIATAAATLLFPPLLLWWYSCRYCCCYCAAVGVLALIASSLYFQHQHCDKFAAIFSCFLPPVLSVGFQA